MQVPCHACFMIIWHAQANGLRDSSVHSGSRVLGKAETPDLPHAIHLVSNRAHYGF